jgi:hypothetical protein
MISGAFARAYLAAGVAVCAAAMFHRAEVRRGLRPSRWARRANLPPLSAGADLRVAVDDSVFRRSLDLNPPTVRVGV